MSVKYWGDPASQPCRTVHYILKKWGIDHEYIRVRLYVDNRTEEFKKTVHPKGIIPTIEHEGQKIFESATQSRYLLDAFECDENLLPRSDRKKRSQVESLLDWNNTTVRPNHCGSMKRISQAKRLGLPDPIAVCCLENADISEEEKKEITNKLYSVLDEIEQMTSSHDYLVDDNLSIADIQIYNEILDSKLLIGYDLSKHPNTVSWMDRIESDPVVQEINEEMRESMKNIQR